VGAIDDTCGQYNIVNTLHIFKYFSQNKAIIQLKLVIEVSLIIIISHDYKLKNSKINNIITLLL
jgi:hypothetical protein